MSRPSDARERLLSAAIDLIWTSSYASVGVDDICVRADVRKGSFYHFFPSKADLALAAYDEHWARRQPQYDRLFGALTPPLERIMGWCALIRDKQLELHAKHGFVCGCAYCNIGSELGTLDERLRAKSDELIRRTRAYLESAIRDAQRLGEVQVEEVTRAAEAVQSCVVGQLLLAKVHNEPSMLLHLEDSVLRLLAVPRKRNTVVATESSLDANLAAA